MSLQLSVQFISTQKYMNPGIYASDLQTIGFTLVSSIEELVWTVFHVFISYFEQDNLNLIINLSNFLKLCLIAF